MNKMFGFIDPCCNWVVANDVVRKLYYICREPGNSAAGEEIRILLVVESCSAKLEGLVSVMRNEQKHKAGLLRPHVDEGRLHSFRGPNDEAK